MSSQGCFGVLVISSQDIDTNDKATFTSSDPPPTVMSVPLRLTNLNVAVGQFDNLIKVYLTRYSLDCIWRDTDDPTTTISPQSGTSISNRIKLTFYVGKPETGLIRLLQYRELQDSSGDGPDAFILRNGTAISENSSNPYQTISTVNPDLYFENQNVAQNEFFGDQGIYLGIMSAQALTALRSSAYLTVQMTTDRTDYPSPFWYSKFLRGVSLWDPHSNAFYIAEPGEKTHIYYKQGANITLTAQGGPYMPLTLYTLANPILPSIHTFIEEATMWNVSDPLEGEYYPSNSNKVKVRLTQTAIVNSTDLSKIVVADLPQVTPSDRIEYSVATYNGSTNATGYTILSNWAMQDTSSRLGDTFYRRRLGRGLPISGLAFPNGAWRGAEVTAARCADPGWYSPFPWEQSLTLDQLNVLNDRAGYNNAMANQILNAHNYYFMDPGTAWTSGYNGTTVGERCIQFDFGLDRDAYINKVQLCFPLRQEMAQPTRIGMSVQKNFGVEATNYDEVYPAVWFSGLQNRTPSGSRYSNDGGNEYLYLNTHTQSKNSLYGSYQTVWDLPNSRIPAAEFVDREYSFKFPPIYEVDPVKKRGRNAVVSKPSFRVETFQVADINSTLPPADYFRQEFGPFVQAATAEDLVDEYSIKLFTTRTTADVTTDMREFRYFRNVRDLVASSDGQKTLGFKLWVFDPTTNTWPYITPSTKNRADYYNDIRYMPTIGYDRLTGGAVWFDYWSGPPRWSEWFLDNFKVYILDLNCTATVRTQEDGSIKCFRNSEGAIRVETTAAAVLLSDATRGRDFAMKGLKTILANVPVCHTKLPIYQSTTWTPGYDVTASSKLGNDDPWKALDGDVTTTWRSEQRYTGANGAYGGGVITANAFSGEYIQVTFPRPTGIANVSLSFTANGVAKGWSLLASNDSSTWTCLGNVDNNNLTVSSVSSTNASVAFTSMRVVVRSLFHKNNSNTNPSFAHIATMGANISQLPETTLPISVTGGSNVFRGFGISASTSQTAYGPERLWDGNTSTTWRSTEYYTNTDGTYDGSMSTGGYDGEYVQLTFSAPTGIVDVTLTGQTGNGTPSNWTLLGSVDATTWTYLGYATNTADSTTSITSADTSQGFLYMRAVVQSIVKENDSAGSYIELVSISGNIVQSNAVMTAITTVNDPVWEDTGVGKVAVLGNGSIVSFTSAFSLLSSWGIANELCGGAKEPRTDYIVKETFYLAPKYNQYDKTRTVLVKGNTVLRPGETQPQKMVIPEYAKGRYFGFTFGSFLNEAIDKPFNGEYCRGPGQLSRLYSMRPVTQSFNFKTNTGRIREYFGNTVTTRISSEDCKFNVEVATAVVRNVTMANRGSRYMPEERYKSVIYKSLNVTDDDLYEKNGVFADTTMYRLDNLSDEATRAISHNFLSTTVKAATTFTLQDDTTSNVYISTNTASIKTPLQRSAEFHLRVELNGCNSKQVQSMTFR